MDYIYPVYRPSIGKLEKEYVNDCIETGWISSRGKYVALFEKKLSRYIRPDDDKGRVVAVSNGTVALHLAMLALGIRHADEVIVPSFTYIAASNCIEYVGGIPVFADSNPDDWSIDIGSVRKRITSKTRAVIAVHLYGVPTDLAPLRALCDEFGLFLVEDCAESLGGFIDGIHCGRQGHISTFSFFGNKTITTGEGGAIYTEINSIYERAVRLKSQGLAKYREYWHDMIGYNFRMTNIAAAIGCAQMERIEDILKAKRNIDSLYRSILGAEDLTFQKVDRSITPSCWITAFLAPNETARDEIRSLLAQNGIETRPTFFPVHTMPMYNSSYSHLPICESFSPRGINLPSYPDLKEEDVRAISKVIIQAINSLSAGKLLPW